VDVMADYNNNGLANVIAPAQERMRPQAIEQQRANIIKGEIIEAKPVEN
jgi:hypothetical protein